MDVCWNAGIPAPNPMAHIPYPISHIPSNSTLNGYRLPTGADLTGRQHHLPSRCGWDYECRPSARGVRGKPGMVKMEPAIG